MQGVFRQVRCSAHRPLVVSPKEGSPIAIIAGVTFLRWASCGGLMPSTSAMVGATSIFSTSLIVFRWKYGPTAQKIAFISGAADRTHENPVYAVHGRRLLDIMFTSQAGWRIIGLARVDQSMAAAPVSCSRDNW